MKAKIISIIFLVLTLTALLSSCSVSVGGVSLSLDFASKGTSIEKALDVGYNETEEQTFKAVKKNDCVYFKFIPNETSNYVINAVNNDDYVLYLYASDNESEWIKYSENKSLSFNFYKGSTYYIKVYTQDADFCLNIQTKITGESRDKAISVTLNEPISDTYDHMVDYIDYVWFKFTTTETTYYKFNVSGNSSYNISIYKENEFSNVINNDYEGVSALEANTTYYVEVKVYDANRYNHLDFSISSVTEGSTRGSAIALNMGDNNVTYAEDGKVWLKFVPTEAGKYTFATACSDSIYMYLTDESGYRIKGTYGYSCSATYNFRSGETCYIELYSAEAASTGFNVNVSMVPAGYERDTAIELDNTLAYTGTYAFAENNGGEVWFKFTTPSYYTTYVITVDAEYGANLYLYYNTNSYTVTSASDTIVYQLNSNAIYYLKVDMDTVDTEFDIKVEMQGASANSAYEISSDYYYYNFYNSGIINGVDDVVWFKFAPSMTGNYSFSLENFAYATANVNVYEGSDLTTLVATGTEATVATAELTSGVTYYVEVIMTQSYDYDFNIYAAPEGYSYQSAVEIDGDDTTISGDYLAVLSNSAVWFKFTATESKCYKFSHDNSYYNYIRIYDANMSSLKTSYERSIMYNMTEGVTYYIYVNFGSTYDAIFDLTIEEAIAGSTRETAIAITSTSTFYDVNITEGGQQVWFKITPSSSGYRYIYLTGMPSTAYAMLYTGTNTSYTDYNYGSSNFYVYEYLYYYNTYYVCVYLSNNTSTGSFNIYYY